MKKLMAIFVMAMFLNGCVFGVGTIKSSLNDPAFKQANQPVRELRVALYADSMRRLHKAFEHIEEVSELMESQVGVRLVVTQHLIWEWKRDRLQGRIRQMYRENHSVDFDIALGFGPFAWWEGASIGLMLPVPVGLGMIDDTYRRYITLKVIDLKTTAHEIFHSMIYSHAHSTTGIMQGISVGIIPYPGLPTINGTRYLSPMDREEILKNKWRDFSVRPDLPAKYQKDVIKENL